MPGKQWSDHDRQQVVDHYPIGGAQAVLPHLKKSHTLDAIRKKAQYLGVRKNQPFKTCEVSRSLLDALERAYSSGKRVQLQPIADRFNVSPTWLSHIAQTRGIATTKCLHWGEHVDAMIVEMEGMTPDSVKKRLNAAGYRYPLTAIAKRQQQLRVSCIDDNLHAPAQVATALGVDRAKVSRWIKTGALETTTRSTSLGEKAERASITSKALRDFIVTHPGEIDLRRIAPAWQPWFIDLLTNKIADANVGASKPRAA